MTLKSKVSYMLNDTMFRCLTVYSMLYHLVNHFVESRALPYARNVMNAICQGNADLDSWESFSLSEGHVKNFCTADDLTLHFEVKHSFFTGAIIVYCFVAICICVSMLWKSCGSLQSNQCKFRLILDRGSPHNHLHHVFQSLTALIAVFCSGLAIYTFNSWHVDSFLVFGTESDKTDKFSLFYERFPGVFNLSIYHQNLVDVLTTLPKESQWRLIRDVYHANSTEGLLSMLPYVLEGVPLYLLLRLFVAIKEKGEQHYMIESDDITTKKDQTEKDLDSDSEDEWAEKQNDETVDMYTRDPYTVGEIA